MFWSINLLERKWVGAVDFALINRRRFNRDQDSNPCSRYGNLLCHRELRPDFEPGVAKSLRGTIAYGSAQRQRHAFHPDHRHELGRRHRTYVA
jgi:hypothetical protein